MTEPSLNLNRQETHRPHASVDESVRRQGACETIGSYVAPRLELGGPALWQSLAEKTNVVGVVLNRCRYPQEQFGYTVRARE